MKYLQHVNLSANIMTSDAVNEMAAMIRNNKYIKVVFLPDCSLNQNDLRLIIQAMQTVSSLEYVDLSSNKVDNELASDIAVLFANNSKLEQLNVNELTLKQDSFQNLKPYLLKFKIKHLNITNCTFTYKDAVYLGIFISRNSNIQELIISHCEIIGHKAKTITMTNILVSVCQLKELMSNNVVISSFEQMLLVSKDLRHVDLSGNVMAFDSVADIRFMILGNEQLEKLCLPNCVLDQKEFRFIIQAMQTLSSLFYVDFSASKVDNELASDVAILFNNNAKLQLKIAVLVCDQKGFQQLRSHLTNITVVKDFSITKCCFTYQDATNLAIAIGKSPTIQKLDLSNCTIINTYKPLIKTLSLCTNLKWLDLSDCLILSQAISQIPGILKQMKYLQHVNLSGNILTSNIVNEIAAMIRSNKYIEAVFLRDCSLNQNYLRCIIQAMLSLLSLRYVDFSASKVDNELASDVAILFNNNNKLQLKIAILACDQKGFQQLRSHLTNITVVKELSITNCCFTDQDATNLAVAIGKCPTIQKVDLSNCKIPMSVYEPLIKTLPLFTNLEWLDLSNCLLCSQTISQILNILKHMKYLHTVKNEV